jgi:GxxExxY protein
MEDKLTETVIGCAMKVHRSLGAGFLESVYANALAHELGKAGISYQREAPINVVYDNTIVGEFRSDFQVENKLIIELKAVEVLSAVHEVQVVNYLSATNINVGLLLNFGSNSLQFKRKHRRKHQVQPASPIRLR